MRKKLFVCIGILLVVCGGILYLKTKKTETDISLEKSSVNTEVYTKVEVTVNSNIFTTFVSDTETLRGNGLSNFPLLKENEGMLFVFEKVGAWGFWMKDMNFPIDIVWLDSKKTIVHVQKNVSPETFPKIFFPEDSSLYAIELPAGTLDKNKITTGDTVSFTLK